MTRVIPRHAGTAYLLCTSPRTGSTLLAEGLAGTGLAGRPLEYFDIHQHNEQWWVEHLGVADDSQYLGKVLQAAATANGIVGIKVHWHQFGALHAKVASAAAQRTPLSSVFPNLKHIWLTRTNKIAQAISYYRASRTNLWQRRTIGKPDPPQAADAQFDYREIDRLVALIHRFDASWSRYFAAVGMAPLQIVYEDMVTDFGGTVRAVLRHIGVDAEHVAIPTPTLQRQADTLSEAWERQYRSIGDMFVRARAQQRKAARAGGSQLRHPVQMPEPERLQRNDLAATYCV